MVNKLTIIVTAILLSTHYSLPTSYAATLLFYPQNIGLAVGETAVIEVRIDTEGDLINAVEAIGSLDNPNVSVESVAASNSIFTIFIDQSKTGDRSFRLVGGVPGGTDKNGVIGTIIVRGVSEGGARFLFDENSKAILNTADTKEATLKLLESAITVSRELEGRIILSSRTHPDESNWYAQQDLHIHWDLEEGTEYSYVVSRDFSESPDDVPDRPAGALEWLGDINIRINNDGIYYVLVKRVGKDAVSRFRAQIDTVPPEWIQAEISAGVPETDGEPFVSFFAQDSLSGIDRYEIKIDDGEFSPAEAPYVIPESYRTITLRAYDRAGNGADRLIRGEAPIDEIFQILLALLLVALAGLALKHVNLQNIRQKIRKGQ